MKNADVISVIVPIYNVERYLRKCIDSIINQTYDNLEIILVDDGSTDSSPDICDEYSKKDARIRTIHKKNGGLSSARNAGLAVCTGKYIGFVDSDDFIEPHMYERLAYYINSENCDLAECGVNNIYENKVAHYKRKEDEILSGYDTLKLHLQQTGTNFIPRVAVWSKLFRKEFWKDKRFPESKVHEDYMITCQAFYEANYVAIVHEGLYNHLLSNIDSIVNSKFSQKDLFLENQYKKRVDYLESKGDLELSYLAKTQYYYNILTLYWKCAINRMPEMEKFRMLIIENYDDIIKKTRGLIRLQFKMVRYFPKLYISIRLMIIKFR